MECCFWWKGLSLVVFLSSVVHLRVEVCWSCCNNGRGAYLIKGFLRSQLQYRLHLFNRVHVRVENCKSRNSSRTKPLHGFIEPFPRLKRFMPQQYVRENNQGDAFWLNAPFIRRFNSVRFSTPVPGKMSFAGGMGLSLQIRHLTSSDAP